MTVPDSVDAVNVRLSKSTAPILIIPVPLNVANKYTTRILIQASQIVGNPGSSGRHKQLANNK